jgi:hypothetical protein
MMRTIDVASWEAFEKKVNTIEAGKASDSASPVLFRGLSDSRWPLSTTLERHGHFFKAYGYLAFLRHRGFPSPFLDVETLAFRGVGNLAQVVALVSLAGSR